MRHEPRPPKIRDDKERIEPCSILSLHFVLFFLCVRFRLDVKNVLASGGQTRSQNTPYGGIQTILEAS